MQKPVKSATPARGVPREADPSPEHDGILTGHFRSGPDYACVRPRGGADWLLIYTRAGAGWIGSGAHRAAAEAGDLFLSPPGTPHDYRTAEAGRWEILWAHFLPRPDWWELLNWPVLPSGWMHVRVGAESRVIERRFRDLHREAVRGRGDASAQRLAMNALEEVLIRGYALGARRARPVDARTGVVLAHLAENLAERLSLAGLARQSGQSVARLTREFRRQTGRSIQQYLEELRLDRARQLLLRTTLSVKEISAETGFASAFYFSQRFARRFGRSPRAFRRGEALG